jgi:carboxyltransferase family protein
MSAVANPPLLEELLAAISYEEDAAAFGNLRLGRGKLGARAVRAALVENRRAGGSLGALECDGLAQAFTESARERTPVVLFLDSAGARVSEGLRALGAFRMLYRAGLEASLAGVPIAAVLGKNCYGGGSMLAHLASRRLFSPATQLAMSGPTIIASSAGVNALDEMFIAMAQAAMSPQARAKASAANVLWQEGTDLAAWLGETLVAPNDAVAAQRARHDEIAARLDKRDNEAPFEDVRRRDLEKIYAEGHEARESAGFLEGNGRREGRDEAFVGIVGKSALGTRRAWRLADAVWRHCDRPPAHLEVFLDCATHAARLEEEKVVLTEFIVDMGFALAALGSKGASIGLTVLGKAGGGVYVALAAPAPRVASVYGAADIQVLPATAVAAILGESTESAPSFAEYRAARVAEEEIKLGFVPPR